MMTGTGSEDRVRVPGAVYGYPVRTGTEYGVRVTPACLERDTEDNI